MKIGGTLAESPAGGAVSHLELAAWREEHGLVAGITTREGDFHLANRGSGHWLKFQQEFDRRFPAVVAAQQVHANTVRLYEKRIPGLQVADGIDGHATSQTGILLTVTIADCVPIYLAHPPSKTLALLHAGWRGIAAGILEAGISLLTRQSHAPPADIAMHCGVSICGDCYEVGPEVLSALKAVAGTRAGSVDLRAELVRRAEALGLRRVTRSTWCSAHHADNFHSHRRSGGSDGRMLAFLGAPAA